MTAQWAGLVAPIVAKCEVAANFGESVTWDREGADALGKLIKEMADKLDYACDHPVLAAAGRVAEITKQRLSVVG